VLRRRVISAWRGFCLIHAGLEAGIQDLVNLSVLLVSDAPEAGYPSEGAPLRLNRTICKAIQRGRLQPLPSASI
jgi:hypothetical protein